MRWEQGAWEAIGFWEKEPEPIASGGGGGGGGGGGVVLQPEQSPGPCRIESRSAGKPALNYSSAQRETDPGTGSQSADSCSGVLPESTLCTLLTRTDGCRAG